MYRCKAPQQCIFFLSPSFLLLSTVEKSTLRLSFIWYASCVFCRKKKIHPSFFPLSPSSSPTHRKSPFVLTLSAYFLLCFSSLFSSAAQFEQACHGDFFMLEMRLRVRVSRFEQLQPQASHADRPLPQVRPPLHLPLHERKWYGGPHALQACRYAWAVVRHAVLAKAAEWQERLAAVEPGVQEE